LTADKFAFLAFAKIIPFSYLNNVISLGEARDCRSDYKPQPRIDGEESWKIIYTPAQQR
jgi:hypothetical protein